MMECKCGKVLRPRNRTGLCRACVNEQSRCSDCGQLRATGQDHQCASVDLQGERRCRECDRVLSNEGKERWLRVCPQCNKKKWRQKEKQQRREAKQSYGGSCQRCGYNKNWAALHFHHVDGSEKYKWSSKGSASIAEVRAHPERFALLCANCHIEEHNPEEATELLPDTP